MNSPTKEQFTAWDLNTLQYHYQRSFKLVNPQLLISQGFFGVDGISVEWMDGYDNSPEFVLRCHESNLVDDKLLRYEQKDRCYFAHLNGYVRFYAWSGPNNEGGFGGSCFWIQLTTDQMVELKGPWSSRSSVMNKLGFEPSMEVRLDVYKDPERPWACTHYGAHVTVAMMKAILKATHYPWWLAEETEIETNPKVKGGKWDTTGENHFIPVHRRGSPKGFFDQKHLPKLRKVPTYPRIKKFRVVAPVLTDWHENTQYVEIDNAWRGID